ncbi:MAG TPA: hypothetical protein VLH86_05780 [Patescibacteria group bacterium]|nr:hypothetical protein [Patescibacteria group bacterium]
MILPIIFVALLAGIVGGSYLTNPFNRFTIVRRPFVVATALGTLQAINENHKLRVRQAYPWKVFVILKNFVHILSSRYVKSPRSSAKTVDGIIAGIHAHRFDPAKLLLISGDHFSSLFVRNLGVFYYPMLDTRIESTDRDWHNRQTVYIQTLAYALGVYKQYPIPTTTVTSTGAYRATCTNIYAYPPDTVYSLLHALAALNGKESAAPARYGTPHHTLDTVPATKLLLDEYTDTLRALYEHYRATVFDPSTGLIRRGLHLSGAKDITRRDCSFYDNVVFWKTTALAMDQGLIPADKAFLATLKKRILKTFWLEEPGHFLEDLSEEGVARGYYSSEWLIVLITGFLDPADKNEQPYFARSVAYIQKQGIDQPFPLKYHHDTRSHRQFFAVRIAVASYGGDAIWSFWGMEYIKTLLLLHTYTGDRAYLRTADQHINSYEQNMLRYGGFPEVYDPQGNLLQTPLYRSIRQTGWVIGFEQVRAMRQAMRSK